MRVPTMLKQVIFWCAVFVVAVISAVLIGEMGSGRQSGHVVTLRGSLPNASAAKAPDDNVQQLPLEGHDNGAVNPEMEIRLRDEVPTPPVAAFFDRLPMRIRAEYNNVSRAYKVFLRVPIDIQPGDGQVRLQWPTRTIPAVPSLRLTQPPPYQTFILLETEGALGQRVRVGRFGSQPRAVEFGDHDVPYGQFGIDGGELWAIVPGTPGENRVRVQTAEGQHYRSTDFFRRIPVIS